MQVKLSDYIWKYIAQLGIKHVFMFPGGGAMHLVDSLGKEKDLENITLLHEQSCAMAAETYARISYNMGAILVTTGPGGTNAITGVAAAWLESTPMIVISGQVKIADLKGDSGVRQKGNQEIEITKIVESITKYAVTIMDPKSIKYQLDKAVYLSKAGRPGPVWIDVPLDIQASVIDTENLNGYIPELDENHQIEEIISLDHLARLLINSKKPVLIAGQGIERRNGKIAFRELVEYLQIPILTSWLAVELLEHSHPCNLGKPGMVAPRYSNYTMQEADLIIAIGTRMDSAMIGYNPQDFAPKAKKIIVDIDESEINKFQFDIDMKIVMDATEFIINILEFFKKRNIKIEVKPWLEKCNNWKTKYPLVLEDFRKDYGKVNPYHFIDLLSDSLKDDTVIIPGSSGAGIDVYWMCFKNKKNQRTLATGSLGAMGYGIPAAIGACFASGKETICIEGDGSLQLNIQELSSIKALNLPIKIFVLNNGGYLSIRNMQKTHFKGNFVGADSTSGLAIPDIEAVATGFGWNVFRIENHVKLKDKIEEVLNCKGPTICNVIMEDNIAIQPRVMSAVDVTGSMRSGSLSDMWPFLEKMGEIDEMGK